MTHALNNASHTSVCAELGITRGNDRTQTSLTRHASINKWSFYRSGSISANVTTKLIELTAPSNNDKLGDFRGYNHNALTPYLYDGYPSGLYYGPGGTSFTFTTIVYLEELNVRELSSGSVPYIVIKYYPSATDRTNGTNVIQTTSTLVSETSVTPPTGHTNNQTAKPSSASQIINDTFDVADIPAGNIVYLDVYIGNNGGSTIYGRFGSSISDSYDEVTIYENQYPEITTSGFITGMPTGYTVGFLVLAASSGNCLDDDPLAYGSSIGLDALNFYVGVHGIFSGAVRSMRCTSVVIRVTYDGATRDISVGTISQNSKSSVSSTLPTGKTWAYNKDANITWVSGTVTTTYASCP